MQIGQKIESVADLRQGDVVGLTWIPEIVDGAPVSRATPCGVVVVSQTCDVVQVSASKANLIVAPIIEAPDSNLVANARRGRSPLRIFLKGCGPAGTDLVADLQHSVSVPKTFLLGSELLGRTASYDHDQEARNLSVVIGRAFSRFAFPDEVQASLSKFLRKTRDKAGTSGPLGRVLDWIDPLRVSADQWNNPGRHLRIYVIVPAHILIEPEDADPLWSWEAAHTRLGMSRDLRQLDLNQVSEKLADMCESAMSGSSGVDMTTILRLWELWAEKLQTELLEPAIDEEVSSFTVELVSDQEFTYAQWKRTESLDLEDLSNSTLPISEL